ncbi:hypothetical protein AVEN_241085-1 [Araneus ventricosus]|uniref:Nucleic-acid-binding protein from transposon X-element n=1 Tax=Araneus ventricosus TaxID=182803 RepID=A0A4Y2LMC2_ARAVE|nr:hypothetical protein AVEN_241085-1 [Araneus ventricosus]
MRNRFSNICLVTLPNSRSNAAIYGTIHIGYFQVTMEALREKKAPSMCFKCQQFFHNSRFCTRDPICVKCAGPHESKDCTKRKIPLPNALIVVAIIRPTIQSAQRTLFRRPKTRIQFNIHRPLGMTREPSKK